MLERTCVYEQMHANRKKLPYTVIFKNQYVAINIPAPGFQAGGQLVVTEGWWLWIVEKKVLGFCSKFFQMEIR